MNELTIHDYFKAKGLNEYAISGLMGNLFAESGLNPRNLQDSFESALGMNDNAYVIAVDNGSYTNFVRDKAGFGLAQWTYWSRKQALLDFAKAAGKSIGDLLMQLDFLWKELSESYPDVLAALRSATSIHEASNVVLLQFERPANMGADVQAKRARYGQTYFDKFASSGKENDMGYTNSPLVSYTKLSPNKTSPRTHAIDTITIHCLVGQWTAKQGCDYFANPSAQASANYVVGKDGSIGLCVEEKDRSWCSSSAPNDHRAITIEVASDTFSPYAVTSAAYNALIELVADICKRNGIKKLLWQGDKSLVGQVDKQNMTVHRWFANKACPGDYLYNRHGQIANEVNQRLNAKNDKEDDDMDVVRFKELWAEMRKELQDNDSGAYSEAARNWALNTGLIAGNGTINGQPNCMWQDFLTREQFVTVLYRFAQLMGKA